MFLVLSTTVVITVSSGSSIKPGTFRNIPEHPGTSRNIPEHRIICKIKPSKTEKTSNPEAAKLKPHKCYHSMIILQNATKNLRRGQTAQPVEASNHQMTSSPTFCSNSRNRRNQSNFEPPYVDQQLPSDPGERYRSQV